MTVRSSGLRLLLSNKNTTSLKATLGVLSDSDFTIITIKKAEITTKLS